MARVMMRREKTMPQVAIVTDSTASIPEKLIESLNIHWVPYYIHRGRQVLRDLVTLPREAFYRWLPTADELPQTARDLERGVPPAPDLGGGRGRRRPEGERQREGPSPGLRSTAAAHAADFFSSATISPSRRRTTRRAASITWGTMASGGTN